jgi:PAS domain S-box-containing protein
VRATADEEVARLRDRERQLLTLLGNLPGVAYRTGTTDGHLFDFASAGIEDALGYSAEELGPGGTVRFSHLVHPEDRPRVAAAVEEALEKHQRFTVTFRVLHRDGSIRWLWDRGIGVYDADGKAIWIEGFASDVTEHEQIEEERARLLEEAEHAVSSREGFLSMAMHDIRSPLTALKLHVQASLRRLSIGPDFNSTEMDRSLRRIEAQVERMRVLVDDLLDVTRAASGHLEVRLEEVDLCVVVHETLKRHKLQLEAAGCEVIVRCEEPVVGRWDWLRLEQVLTNLISNAIKYGSSKPVHIAIERRGTAARLEVRDHGTGLTPDDRERLFQRFERLTAQHRAGSTGLGLWIVRTVVQALGGSISCDSDGPGEGTSFVVLLPLEGPPVAPDPPGKAYELPAPQEVRPN